MIFYGRNVVTEALSSKHYSSEVFVEENINQSPKVLNIITLADSKNVKVTYLTRKALENKTKSKEHQGVAVDCRLEQPQLKELIKNPEAGFILISESTFEHNVGAIIRSAEVSGLNGVILPKDVNITPTVAKTSAGGIFHIPVLSLSIYQALKTFKNENYSILGIERSGSYYYDNNLTGNTLFIIGGEDKSLTDGVRSKCDTILEIPQAGKVNSLNMT